MNGSSGRLDGRSGLHISSRQTSDVEALELAQDAVGTDRPWVERDGHRDHEGMAIAGDKVVDPLDDPVGVGVDEL